uniref:G-protein coupled receptors family 2 profile 1 domain-containing protein n=1 Tax=Sander lucioperca TaxID=283035 RepID=A0A8C9ZBJ6_SANLU
MNKRPVTFLCLLTVSGLHCSRNWDGWLCWDDTPAGTYASKNCPNYFVDFDPTGEQRDLGSCC